LATPAHRFRGTFGDDAFGRNAERVARFFGTPRYLIAQTVVVILWIILNSVAVVSHWDPYPFILLNLAFSTQAAYAAPLILLAETRQTARDKAHSEVLEERHTKQEDADERRLAMIRSETRKLEQLLESNTELTRQDKELTEHVAQLAREIRELLTPSAT
jgi:uncharacterized membrane protein